MAKKKKKLFIHITNVVTVALIIECFLCAMMLVNKFGRENCFVRIEETTQQTVQMFNHTMKENQNNLTVFADILAANSSNPDELLQKYMENFCNTQDFDAVCIHRKNGSVFYYGEHPHDQVEHVFAEEVERLPYISDAFGSGNQPEDKYVYQAVPIVRDGQIIAILYGYLTLDDFPGFISSTAFEGRGQFYIVDGNTGDFLMDEYHGELGNMFDGSMDNGVTQKGYDMQTMRSDVQSGRSGYYIFTARQSGDWYYTYYMPLGINNWSMQMTIDEPTAFASYHDVNEMLMVLATCVIVLMVIHVLVLMLDERHTNKKDRDILHRSNYINAVERALINALSNPGYLGHALKIVADELEAETVMLLSLSGRIITNAQYWPSKDKAQAMEMLGRNIRDDFPALFDILSGNESVFYNGIDPSIDISETAKSLFQDMDVRSIMLVPIMDNAGVMKGIITAVNPSGEVKNCEMLECVTYDFFMAMSNQESYAIIQRMGAIDYLTGIKNRNSYESEVGGYAELDCESLWCVFIDVNGLHEVNNTQGHKAGDRMLCAVANAVKKYFGEESSYRMGGDEFIAFMPDSTHQEFMSRKYRIMEDLARKGYYVSVGFAGTEKNANGVFDVEKVVSEAEAIMYKDKWEFYQENEIATDRGHFPKLKTE